MKELLKQLKNITMQELEAKPLSKKTVHKIRKFVSRLQEEMEKIAKLVGEHDALKKADLLLKSLPDDIDLYTSDAKDKINTIYDVIDENARQGCFGLWLNELWQGVDTKPRLIAAAKLEKQVNELRHECIRYQKYLSNQFVVKGLLERVK